MDSSARRPLGASALSLLLRPHNLGWLEMGMRSPLNQKDHQRARCRPQPPPCPRPQRESGSWEGCPACPGPVAWPPGGRPAQPEHLPPGPGCPRRVLTPRPGQGQLGTRGPAQGHLHGASRCQMRTPVSVPGLGAALCLELVGQTRAGHSLQVKGPLWDRVGLVALPGAVAAAGQRCPSAECPPAG